MQSRGRLSLGRVLGAELPADAVPCAVQLPGVEKRRPVHALDKLLNSYVITRIVTAAAATFSNRVTYGALTAAAAPAMKLMTGKTNQLDRGSTWIPVLNGWLASRNLDTMSSKKFRSWFAEHKKQEEEQKRAETAQALTDACRNNANREEN